MLRAQLPRQMGKRNLNPLNWDGSSESRLVTEVLTAFCFTAKTLPYLTIVLFITVPLHAEYLGSHFVSPPVMDNFSGRHQWVVTSFLHSSFPLLCLYPLLHYNDFGFLGSTFRSHGQLCEDSMKGFGGCFSGTNVSRIKWLEYNCGQCDLTSITFIWI